MARLIHGGLFGEMRGALGGVVFTKNAGGEIVRRRSVVVNRNTPAQQNNRALFASGSQQFSALAPEERSTWESPGMGMFTAGDRPLLRPGSPMERSGSGAPMSAPAATLDGAVGKSVFMQYWMWSNRLAQVSVAGTPAGAEFQSTLIRPTEVLTSATWGGIALEIGTMTVGQNSVTVQIRGIAGTPDETVSGGSATGIAVYASSALPFMGARSNKTARMLLTAVQAASREATAGAFSYTAASVGADPVAYSHPIETGQIREIFVYLVDMFGTHRIIGRRQVVIA